MSIPFAFTDVRKMTVTTYLEKLEGDTFYHLVFAPQRKIELHELPLPYLINDQEFNLVDLAISRLVDIDPMLPLKSHAMTYEQYIAHMIKTYPKRAHADSKILICKFERVINSPII